MAWYHYPMSLFSGISRRLAGRGRAICGLLGGLAFAGLLAGCSPEFNWRETRNVEHGYSVLLPGRPASMSREIDLDGLKVQMTMQGARVDRALFTVGAVRLEPPGAALDAARAKALDAMRVAMLRNIGAEPQAGVPVRVAIINGSGAATGVVEAIAVEARGEVAGAPVVMQAVFVSDRDRVWQVVAMVPPAQSAQSRTMLDSFRLLTP